MTCEGGDDATNVAGHVHDIEVLFARLEAAGLGRLHPVEQDIVAYLKVRPLSSWCHLQLRLLTELVAKAEAEGPRMRLVVDTDRVRG